MQEIRKIVLTGGPCAGKTTAMSWVQNAFTEKGYKVLFVPETATELISGGVAPWTCGSNADYQRCQMQLQLEKEKIFTQEEFNDKLGEVLAKKQKKFDTELAAKQTEIDELNRQIKDLNEPATITLQLEEGVDGNEIVIVHQKHDGTYEVIPTTYDPETHTITFTTTSFSNYAIASRTVESPETGAFTGDSGSSETNRVLAAITTAVIVAGAAIIAATKFLNRREKK